MAEIIFDETKIKHSKGFIYDGQLDQVIKVYERDPVKAGELAISIIELAITGSYSSDDPFIEVCLATYEDLKKNYR